MGYGGTCLNPKIWEAEAGILQISGQPGLHNEFKVSLHYIVRPCLEKTHKMRGGRGKKGERQRRGGESRRERDRQRGGGKKEGRKKDLLICARHSLEDSRALYNFILPIAL
jgi:hypothetical protein